MEDNAKHVSIYMFVNDTDVWLICLSVWELDTCCCQLPFHKILGYDINLLALLVDVDYYRPFTISSQKVNKIHDGMIQPFRRRYVICLIHFLFYI